jgi:hypothetical protein
MGHSQSRVVDRSRVSIVARVKSQILRFSCAVHFARTGQLPRQQLCGSLTWPRPSRPRQPQQLLQQC